MGVTNIEKQTDAFIKQRFGDLLAELRKDKGLNQKELAKNLNVSKSSVAHYEQGDNFPSPSVVVEISNFFNVPVDYLYGLVSHSLDYKMLDENFAQNFTFGEILKLMSQMNPSERNHILEDINYIMSYYKTNVKKHN